MTDNAEAFFPNNYQRLASGLLAQIQQHLPPEGVNVIIEGVAKDMAQEAKIPPGTLRERLDAVVNYLNEHGYDARWDTCESGYILQTLNCPYHHMTHEDDTLCNLDMRMIASMLGVVPRLMSRVSDGDNVCSYLVPVD